MNELSKVLLLCWFMGIVLFCFLTLQGEHILFSLSTSLGGVSLGITAGVLKQEHGGKIRAG